MYLRIPFLFFVYNQLSTVTFYRIFPKVSTSLFANILTILLFYREKYPILPHYLKKSIFCCIMYKNML